MLLLLNSVDASRPRGEARRGKERAVEKEIFFGSRKVVQEKRINTGAVQRGA